MIIEQALSGAPADRRPTVTAGRVQPVRYDNARLRSVVGHYIGHSDSDDLIAATLWAAEAFACRSAAEELAGQCQDLSSQIERYERRLTEGFRRSIAREAESATSRLVVDLRREFVVIKGAQAQADKEFERLRLDFGTDPLELYTGATRSGSVADVIHDLLDKAIEARSRAEERLSSFTTEVERLKAVAVRREKFAKSGRSASAERLTHLDGVGLERLIAWLLERDGVTVLRAAGGPGDQGVDILGRVPAGEVVAIQSKYRQRGPVNPRVIYELNGAARDLHGASFAVVVTNSTFSEQATRDAATLNVRLVDGYGLAAWATWGDTLFDVTGIPQAPTLDSAERAARHRASSPLGILGA